MATLQSTIIAERWLDEVVLGAVSAAINGDYTDHVLLPPGIGDVAIMEVSIDASPLATGVAALELQGSRMAVFSYDGGTVVDIVGGNQDNRWSYRGGAAAHNYWSPDPLVLWRQGERLAIASPELDINATPTVVYVWRIKVVRIRPIEIPASPIQLVR